MSRIGINTLFLIPHEVGGTEYYTRSFLGELERQDKENEYVVFCNKENYETFDFTNPLWKKVLCDVNARNRFGRIVYEQCILPFHVLRHGCDVLHSFGYVSPFLSTAHLVVTVHDANWKDHPEDTPWLPRLVLGLLMEGTLFFAKKILVDSEFSNQRLVAHYPQYQGKIRVLEPGLDEGFLKLLSRKQKLLSQVKSPFLLCVSGFYPHKKVLYALELWESIAQDFPKLSFVIIGKNGIQANEVRKKATTLERVVVLDKVTLSELVGLYQNADAFIFPSVYEGFGFPVYEALAAGLPVLVGKKECYSLSAQKLLAELSFTGSSDRTQIKKLMKQKRNTFVLPNYKHSAKKLLSFYLEA